MTDRNAAVLVLDLEKQGVLGEVGSLMNASPAIADKYSRLTVLNFAMIKSAILLPVLQKLSGIREIHLPDRDVDAILVVCWLRLLVSADCNWPQLPALVFWRHRIDLASMKQGRVPPSLTASASRLSESVGSVGHRTA